MISTHKNNGGRGKYELPKAQLQQTNSMSIDGMEMRRSHGAGDKAAFDATALAHDDDDLKDVDMSEALRISLSDTEPVFAPDPDDAVGRPSVLKGVAGRL